jgi:hypothetical protein
LPFAFCLVLSEKPQTYKAGLRYQLA